MLALDRVVTQLACDSMSSPTSALCSNGTSLSRNHVFKVDL